MSSSWRNVIVVGASSGMGEQIARRLASEGCRVALVARRGEALKTIAAEIDMHCPAESDRSPRALSYEHDVLNVEEVPALFQAICRDLGGLDAIFYVSGVMPRFGPGEYDISKDALNVQVNLIGAMAWINEAAQRFAQAKTGTIVGISSVAGDRGRGGLPSYAASKAGFTTYLESIRNRVGALGVKVVTVKPGPIETPMTAGLEGLPLLISADEAAKQIVAGARRGSNVVYVPFAWRPIMAIIRAVPSFIFQRLKKLNS